MSQLDNSLTEIDWLPLLNSDSNSSKSNVEDDAQPKETYEKDIPKPPYRSAILRCLFF